MKLAADANVLLLSALIGEPAKRVLRHAAIGEILTAEVTLAAPPRRFSGLRASVPAGARAVGSSE